MVDGRGQINKDVAAVSLKNWVFWIRTHRVCVFISDDKIRERNFGETFYGPETQLNTFVYAREEVSKKYVTSCCT